MTVQEYNRGLPDEIRMIVWDRKEKYGIKDCCFGFEAEEIPCITETVGPQPVKPTDQNSGDIFLMMFMFALIFLFVILTDFE